MRKRGNEIPMTRLAAAWMIAIACGLGTTLRAEPVVTIADEAVRVSSLTPGAEIAWLSVGHEASVYMTLFRAREGTASDTDRDGVIDIDFPVSIPLRFAFAVVEVATGAWKIGTRDEFASVPIDPSERFGRARGLRPSLDLLEIERNELEVLLVRPHVGAWRLHAIEGSPADADAANDAVLTVRFADLTPLATPGHAVPGTLKPGDVVIALDPEDLGHFAKEIGR